MRANINLALMACAAFAAARSLLPIVGPSDGDFPLFLFHWMAEIREHGIASVSGDFSAYTPPYIYLLNLASLIEPFVGTVAAVKLVNVPFVIAIALGIGAISGSRTAAAVTLVVPSLLVNAFAFGQADVIFTSFLIGFVLFAMREKPTAAAVMFGLALSFKLQAMFLSPLVVYLLLSRQMRVRDALAIPLVYLLMMVPAALAGRPWAELLTIYYHQAKLAPELSLNAPNPWWFVRAAGVDYATGVAVGLVAGAIAGIAIVIAALRMRRGSFTILFVACVCAAVMPYVLPKMTSRYFFVADMLVIALAFACPRFWPTAVLIQFGSLIAELSYFLHTGTAGLAFVPMSLGILTLFTTRRISVAIESVEQEQLSLAERLARGLSLRAVGSRSRRQKPDSA